MKHKHADRLLALVRKRGLVRRGDLEALGIPSIYLYRLRDRGTLEQVGRGLFRLAGQPASEHRSLVDASQLVPKGVICLLSALRFHEMTTQAPFEVWIAIEAKARRPSCDSTPLRVVRMSPRALASGVETYDLENVPVRVFGAAKTVADCFKFRNKIGLDVALEALREYRRRSGDADELWRQASATRVSNVIRPYWEGIAE